MSKFEGQKLAGLFTWKKDDRQGLNGRVELAGVLMIRPGSSFIVSPVRNPVEKGPKYSLFLMPPDAESEPAGGSGAGVGNDDIPF